MTLYGVDISNNQDGGRNTVNIAEIYAEDFAWIMAKVTEGSTFKDADWHRTRDWCKANGKIIVGYHYVRTDSATAQAKNCLQWLGDASIPVMLDFEDGSGDINNYWAVYNAFTAAGMNVALSYIPRWYWQKIGAPDLSRIRGLVASNYVYGSGFASAIYPGDNSPRWAAYGGCQPAILQFSDAALVAGLSMDGNAFRGAVEALQQLLGSQPTEGAFMALTDDEQDELLTKTREIWEQLRGVDGHGWPQLGQNEDGEDLTLVDAIGEIKEDVEK